MDDERARFRRWRRAHETAAARQRAERAAEGPQPERALAECFAALDALAAMGRWPGPRDPVSERLVEEVRRRWVRIGRGAGRGSRR